MKEKVYDQPTEVSVDEGRVVLDGPDGVHVAMTPEAAAETSDRLLEGAIEAKGRKLVAETRAARRLPGSG